MGRRNYGLLDEVFHFVDPIMDDNPWLFGPHNQVQEWVTGSKTTDGQSPYFQTIFPMVIDGFFPGVGSAIGAVDKASTGNWTGAGISALGAMAGLSGMTSPGDAGGSGITASSGTGVGAANSGADSLGSGISGSGVSYGGGYDSFASADSLGSGLSQGGSGVGSAELGSMSANATSNYQTVANNNYAKEVPNAATGKQPGAGWKYYDNGTAISPDGHYYHNGEMVTGAAGQPKGILDYASEYGGKASRAIGSKEGGVALGAAAKASAAAQQNAQQQRMMQMMNRPQPVAQDAGGDRRQVQSFQTLSPYASFNGGYNPRKRGLMG